MLHRGAIAIRNPEIPEAVGLVADSTHRVVVLVDKPLVAHERHRRPHGASHALNGAAGVALGPQTLKNASKVARPEVLAQLVAQSGQDMVPQSSFCVGSVAGPAVAAPAL